jgi:predicted nucleotide-binding protein (sugar kinase/HSP70/actin superfamily)
VAIIVGGVGSVHDALLAAALRSRHLEAVAIEPPGREAFEMGRRLLARGYPATMYFLAGALARTVASMRSGTNRDEPILFVTVGGHCSHYASDYRHTMAAAGFEDVSVSAPSIAALRTWGPSEPLASVFTDVARPLLRACIAGDVLVRLGNQLRVRSSAPTSIDATLRGGAAELVAALEAGRSTRAVFDGLRDRLRSERNCSIAAANRVRVRITGEFFPTLTEGSASHALVRWLESRGAVVETPALTEWVLYALWQLAPALGPRAERLRCIVLRAFARRAAEASVEQACLDDPEALAKIAARYLAPDVRGSAGHLEVGTYLLAERFDRADLVVSVKAFASTPSSSVSDAVLHALSRRRRTGFVSVEVNGDAELHATSRLELALDMARRAKALRRDHARVTRRSRARPDRCANQGDGP